MASNFSINHIEILKELKNSLSMMCQLFVVIWYIDEFSLNAQCLSICSDGFWVPKVWFLSSSSTISLVLVPKCLVFLGFKFRLSKCITITYVQIAIVVFKCIFSRALVRNLNVGARKKSFTSQNFWNLTNQKFPPYSPQNVGAQLHPC